MMAGDMVVMPRLMTIRHIVKNC